MHACIDGEIQRMLKVIKEVSLWCQGVVRRLGTSKLDHGGESNIDQNRLIEPACQLGSVTKPITAVGNQEAIDATKGGIFMVVHAPNSGYIE